MWHNITSLSNSVPGVNCWNVLGDSERENLRLIEMATSRSKAERQATPPLPPQQQRQTDIKVRKPSTDPSCK